MSNLFDKADGKPAIVNTVIAVVAFFIIVICGIWLLNKSQGASTTSGNSTSNSNTQTSTSTRAILKPATVPPKVLECQQAISFNSSGLSGPIQCSNGDLNTIEWQSLASLEPKIMTLGYNASQSQAQSALCSDVANNISNNIEQINFQISSLYYGWSFSSNPTVVLTNGDCTNIDD